MTLHRVSSIHRALHDDMERAARAGRFRWFLLGALGVAPYGCGGRTGDANATKVTGGERGGAAGASRTGGVGEAPPLGVGGDGGGGGPVGAGGYSDYRHSMEGMGGSPEPPPACVDETPLGGGWSRCGNGLLHRASAGLCDSGVPRLGRSAIPDEYAGDLDAGPFIPCREDIDCTDAPYGHCEWEWNVGEQFGTSCLYGCVQDSDCGEQQVCLCGEEPVGRCAPSTCSQDSDCGGNSLCADYIQNPGCGGTAFACQTAADECAIDAECVAGETCTLGPDQRRICSGAQCVIGRPFLVDGRERLAPARERGDWCAELGGAPSADIADPDLRAAVSRGWLEQGLMEHASVAAFARFSLQLMSLGAPPELVSRAAEAMQDEIRHARDCFGLARRHAGEQVGPGPLAIDGALDRFNPTSIVLDTITEGCIGETVAALEAAEALAHCEDPVAREVLSRIAVEEANHAALAWQFVAWALETLPDGAKDRVRDAFDAALTGARREPARTSQRDRELLRYGLVSEALRGPLRASVLAEVIGPCVTALLRTARTPAPSTPRSHEARAALTRRRPRSPVPRSADRGRRGRRARAERRAWRVQNGMSSSEGNEAAS